MTEQDNRYNPNEIEPRWQAKWDADGIYHADIDPSREEILRPDDAALSLRGPAHGPLVRHDPPGCAVPAICA